MMIQFPGNFKFKNSKISVLFENFFILLKKNLPDIS